MAKKSSRKSATKKNEAGTPPNADANVHVTKQTAGAVTGTVLGGVMGGPVGALAGGALGAMVGDSAAKGKKPIKRAVDAIRDEITSGRAKEALKSVGERIKSLGKTKKKKAVVSKKSVDKTLGVKKKSAKVAAGGVKGAKGKKSTTAGTRKRVKKKS